MFLFNLVPVSYQYLRHILSYLILGTRGPVWLNGSNPANVGETTTLTVCARVKSQCCRLHWNIQVKKCSEMSTMFFVYKLQAVPGCPIAYCAGQLLQLVNNPGKKLMRQSKYIKQKWKE